MTEKNQLAWGLDLTEQLTRLRAIELSYVPFGANKKKFLITKEGEMPKTTAEHVTELLSKIVLKNDDKISLVLKDLSADDQGAVKSSLKVFQALEEKLKPELAQEILGLTGAILPVDIAALKAATDQVAVEKARADKAEADLAKVTKEKKDAEDNAEFPIKKDGTLDEEKIPAEIRKSVVALWKKDKATSDKLALVQKSLEDERDARVAKQFESDAAAYKAIPVATVELAKCMKEVADKAPDAFKVLETVLKSASEAIAKADPTKAIGSDQGGGAGDGGSDPEVTKIEKAAQAHFAGEKAVTKEQAFDRFVTQTDTGRKMYSEYKNKQKSA